MSPQRTTQPPLSRSFTKLSATTTTTATSFIIKSKSINFLHELLPLRQNYFHGFGNGTIPKIVHITYKSQDVPIQYENYLRHCLNINPDVAFLFWTDSQAEEFVKLQTSHSRDEVEHRLYHILTTYQGVEKADVLRLMLLYFIGGIYMDLDTECKISFTDIHSQVEQKIRNLYNHSEQVDEASCLLDQEQWLQTRIHWSKKYCAMNNLMICRPRHTFFQYVLYNLKDDDKKTFIMDKTGPFLLTRRYEEYIDLLERGNNSVHWNGSITPLWGNRSDQVMLAHPDWFSPLVDAVSHYENQCKKHGKDNIWIKEGCEKDLPHYKKTVEEKKKNAFLIHWFLHLGYAYNQHLLKQHFPIHSVAGIYVVSLM